MGKKNKKPWEMKMSADGKTGEIYVYGDIEKYQWIEEDTTSNSFKNDLDRLGDVSTINLYVNSPGGHVFEGITIGNMLKRHKAYVNAYVDGLAASIASVIIMAADKIYMPKNSMLMIHNALVGVVGNATELRKMADDLDRISNSAKQSYLEKAGDKLTDEKVQEMMDAETWLSADQAYEYGLCDEVIAENNMVASVSEELFKQYKNVPKQLTKVKQSKVEPNQEQFNKIKFQNELDLLSL